MRSVDGISPNLWTGFVAGAGGVSLTLVHVSAVQSSCCSRHCTVYSWSVHLVCCCIGSAWQYATDRSTAQSCQLITVHQSMDALPLLYQPTVPNLSLIHI